MNIIDIIEKEGLRSDIPDFNIGDDIRVYYKIIEGNRERIQAYEGTVIARRGGSIRETFTVRRISFGIGVRVIGLVGISRRQGIVCDLLHPYAGGGGA